MATFTLTTLTDLVGEIELRGLLSRWRDVTVGSD